jgi:hypothetical protein
MSNCYDHELKMNMLNTYYFKDKKQAKENLNKNLQELKEWYQLELDKYITAHTNFDQWFNEYTGQSFDEMLNQQASEQMEKGG